MNVIFFIVVSNKRQYFDIRYLVTTAGIPFCGYQITNIMAMPKNLFFVRHGQSEGNLARKLHEESGNESSFTAEFLNLHESQYALTELGITQAKKAGDWFKENGFINFDRMLVSNNGRAMQTAAYLELPHGNWMIDCNIRERDGGLFNVIPPSIRDLHYDDQQKFYKEQPFFFRPPQGESLADVYIRMKIIVDTIARECDGKNVIITCHGHVMRVARFLLERMSLQKINAFLTTDEEWGRVPNCSIIHYTRENPEDNKQGLSPHLDWVRMIRPSGGGAPQDEFTIIERKKFSNEELLEEAKINRGKK